MSEAAPSRPTFVQDLVGGILAVAFGAFALFEASDYPMGSLLRMGPGFFPCAVAALIVLLGLLLIGAAFRSRPTAADFGFRLRPVAAISAGITIFALLLERAGLVPATLALVLVSSLAEPRWRPLRAGILAVAVTVLVYIVFIVVLQIPVAAVSL